jgi:hypothetical protein
MRWKKKVFCLCSSQCIFQRWAVKCRLVQIPRPVSLNTSPPIRRSHTYWSWYYPSSPPQSLCLSRLSLNPTLSHFVSSRELLDLPLPPSRNPSQSSCPLHHLPSAAMNHIMSSSTSSLEPPGKAGRSDSGKKEKLG